MAKGFYFGVANKARKGKKMYFGVAGVARKVKKIYFGVANVARLVWSAGLTGIRVIREPSSNPSVGGGIKEYACFIGEEFLVRVTGHNLTRLRLTDFTSIWSLDKDTFDEPVYSNPGEFGVSCIVPGYILWWMHVNEGTGKKTTKVRFQKIRLSDGHSMWEQASTLKSANPDVTMTPNYEFIQLRTDSVDGVYKSYIEVYNSSGVYQRRITIDPTIYHDIMRFIRMRTGGDFVLLTNLHWTYGNAGGRILILKLSPTAIVWAIDDTPTELSYGRNRITDERTGFVYVLVGYSNQRSLRTYNNLGALVREVNLTGVTSSAHLQFIDRDGCAIVLYLTGGKYKLGKFDTITGALVWSIEVFNSPDYYLSAKEPAFENFITDRIYTLFTYNTNTFPSSSYTYFAEYEQY